MIRIEHGDCLEVMPTLGEVDSIVTDPPYHLTSIVKRFGAEDSKPVQAGVYRRSTAGFMGKKWDGGDVAFRVETWRLAYDCLKPGGYLIAFGGTRTYHRLACAIEDAGFEIRDQLQWLFGSGFPKSHNLTGKVDGYEGWGTALKPACEPIVLARKPLSEKSVAANVLRHGTGAVNVDGCRVDGDFESGWSKSGSKASENLAMSGANYARDPKPDHSSGRWPANVVHDGSDEVLEAFAAFGENTSGAMKRTVPSYDGSGVTGFLRGDSGPNNQHGDTGTAARFFYSAKADASDRLGSKHPTVKPVDLMRWLVRLVTPPGGTVLDPFAGSGTTGMACLAESFNAILIERESEYVADIKARVAHVHGHDTPLFAEVT